MASPAKGKHKNPKYFLEEELDDLKPYLHENKGKKPHLHNASAEDLGNNFVFLEKINSLF